MEMMLNYGWRLGLCRVVDQRRTRHEVGVAYPVPYPVAQARLR